jgi:pimeloyl-ACP methyl ester carboxylesterase
MPDDFWRSPDLGPSAMLDLPGGRVQYQEAGTGPSIVFVHGVLSNANLWRKVVARLAPAFRCVTLDLPLGSHRVPMAPDADLSPRGLADLIADALAALDLDEVTLVGSDTGGALCQIAITRRPERVGRLMLTSCDYRENFPPPTFRRLVDAAGQPGRLRRRLARMEDRSGRHLPAAYGSVAKRPIDDDASDSYVLPALHDDAVFADLERVMVELDPAQAVEAADRLGEFDKPVLIAWSADDPAFPVADARALAAAFPSSRLEWIEDSYAFSPEDRPDRVAELVAAFVKESAAVR